MDVPSRNALVVDTTVQEEVNIQHGTLTVFENCRLPSVWNLGTLTKNTQIYFKNCEFPEGTQIPADSFLYVSADNDTRGLDLNNQAVENLPYFRVEAFELPENQDKTLTFNENTYHVLNRGVDGVEIEPISYQFVAGTDRTIDVSNIDPEQARGGIVFRNMSFNDTRGTLHWPVGVDVAMLTFSSE